MPQGIGPLRVWLDTKWSGSFAVRLLPQIESGTPVPFDNLTIRLVWVKGTPSTDPDNWRKDACGAWMRFQDYGNRNSEYGWEIDHIIAAKDGEKDDDSLHNLQPLHWRNNVAKGKSAVLTCAATANGQRNGPV
jgi:hypothetical protein